MRTGWCSRAVRCRRRQGGQSSAGPCGWGLSPIGRQQAQGALANRRPQQGVRRAGQEGVVSDGPGRAFGTNGAGWCKEAHSRCAGASIQREGRRGVGR